jgi:uncharacterized protein YdhG (YjbR/CyaY superfamily)
MKPALAKPKTVDDYIAALPPDVQAVLQAIRQTVRDAAPEASERLSYGMPTFFLKRVLVHFAAFKDHIGLYPPVRDPDLQQRTRPYQGEKGNLRFPLDRPIPYDVIEDIVRARVEAETQR